MNRSGLIWQAILIEIGCITSYHLPHYQHIKSEMVKGSRKEYKNMDFSITFQNPSALNKQQKMLFHIAIDKNVLIWHPYWQNDIFCQCIPKWLHMTLF